jgi:hypothetical protein
MSWALFSGTPFDQADWYLEVFDPKFRISDPSQKSRRRGAADLVRGVVDHGDRGTQRVGHGEVAESHERDVGTAVRVQGGHDAE